MYLNDGRIMYEAIGGRPTLEKVHKVFYDKVYAHPWIGQYFAGTDQTLIENQQTDFMSARMGGPKNYLGKLPMPAHKHMFIDTELFDLRQNLLGESLKEVGIEEVIIKQWLNLDEAFRKGIEKRSLDDCQQRYADEPVMNFPNPNRRAA